MPPRPRQLAAFAAALLTLTTASGVELQPGDIVAMDARGDRLLRIDPLTGARQLIVAGGIAGDGIGVAIDADDQLLVSIGYFGLGPTNGVVRVDPVSGASSFVTTGGMLAGPLGIIVERNGGIVVSDSAGGARGSIVRIDPANGAQALVSSGGELFFPAGLSLLPDGDFFVTGTGFGGAGYGVALRVDAMTGEQHVIAKPTLSFAWAAVTTPEGEAYFSTVFPGLVVRVDVATGEQTPVAEIGNGLAMALEPSGTLIVAVDGGLNTRIIRVDPQTGGTEGVATFPAFVTGLAVVPFRVLEVEI